jgi:site-specific DNA-methyltransferase (cytosine-N4-specific)
MYRGSCEDLLAGRSGKSMRGKVQLLLTSPPFPLNRKKRYGNKVGEEYLTWIASLAPLFREVLADRGSIVVEIGNAWNPGSPTMSTLPLKALLRFLEAGDLHLCQEFVAYNTARLPSPAEWVTVQRIRVKDAFTHVWWMSAGERPKADNRRVLKAYSAAMTRLLERGTYNSGTRPSEHSVGEASFLKNNGGSIPPNVLVPPQEELPSALLPVANTASDDPYQRYCRDHGVTPHPARMPIALAEFFIQFLTEPGDLVFDPFGGSNTTGAAAERLGRRWISVEMEETYARSSQARFASPGARGAGTDGTELSRKSML